MYSENFKEPVFCFSIDLDWAKEPMIEKTLAIFKEYNVPVTPFITHRSEAIEAHYKKKPTWVGLHPNFWSDSTQGNNCKEIVDSLRKLWPKALGFRSHRWYEDLKFSKLFRDNGFLYDSTTCMFLHPNIMPYRCASGLLQFPVFFEDRWFLSSSWDFRTILKRLEQPGLKVFDFHPSHVCGDLRVQHFLIRLLKVVNFQRWKCYSMLDLYRKLRKDED